MECPIYDTYGSTNVVGSHFATLALPLLYHRFPTRIISIGQEDRSTPLSSLFYLAKVSLVHPIGLIPLYKITGQEGLARAELDLESDSLLFPIDHLFQDLVRNFDLNLFWLDGLVGE